MHAQPTPAPQYIHTHPITAADGGRKLTFLECHKLSITIPDFIDEKTGSERRETMCPKGSELDQTDP